MPDNSHLKKTLQNQDFGFLALIDPDLKNDNILDQIIECVNRNNFSAVLVGGSLISDEKYSQRLEQIKLNKKKELIWILEHEEVFTAGTNFKENEILDKSINWVSMGWSGSSCYFQHCSYSI